MNFNPDLNKQAAELLFFCKKNSPNHPSIFFNESVVPKVKEQKHLGLTLDSKLSFERQRLKRVLQSLNIFRNSYPLKLLIKRIKLWSVLIWMIMILYITYQPQINLGVTLNSLMEKVERTQYQAALAITGTWQGTNRSKLCEELGWETISDRRWCRRILQIHNIEKYKIPSYLRDKLPPHRRPLYRFNNSNTFQEGARPPDTRSKALLVYMMHWDVFSIEGKFESFKKPQKAP